MRFPRFMARPLVSLPLVVAVVTSIAFIDARYASAVDKKLAETKSVPLFERDVLPVFKAKCAGCHNPKSPKAELDLTSAAGVFRGGESGEILDHSKPEDSLLYDMVHEKLMPPKGKPQLSDRELELIESWIKTGARASAASVTSVSQHDVLPILFSRCTVCHGLRTQEAGLDLRTKALMLKGGKSGPAIVPGKPHDSLLLKRIHSKEMPPGKRIIDVGVRPPEADEIELITQWIAAGCPEIEMTPDIATTTDDPLVSNQDRQFWAFQPPQPQTEPDVKAVDRVRSPIDAFVLARLEARGLTLSPEADRLTLIRRVAFDLTGLPPKWLDVERFLADQRPDAYEQMVERFLASNDYGERWAQYWLDLAGYADSEGKRSADPIRPHAWRYRDYVIRAFNNDKPYDHFLMQQIAGDELADYENAPEMTQELVDNLVATAFLRMAPDGTGSDIVNTVIERLEVITDEIDILGSAVLGLTIKCAQCHTHKYDPIPQRDYYRLMAIFRGAYDEHDWLKPSVVPGQTIVKSPGRVLDFVTAEEKAEWQAEQAAIEKQIAELKSNLARQRLQLTEKHVAARIAKLPAELREDLKKMLATPAAKRDAVLRYLGTKFEKQLAVTETELKKLEPGYAKQVANIEIQTKDLTAKMPSRPIIRALWDRGVPSPAYIYRRGEFNNPGRLVGPGVPSMLTDGKTPFDVKPPWPGAKKTGRRLAFAKWLTQPDHPLTARVMVNRIWKNHFGTGIVTSTENFGHTGASPTHPKLLDWLAREFIANGWSVKAMHRLMLNSSTYRQQSGLIESAGRTDPENSLLWRMPLRRLEAEAVRDSIVFVADRLDRRRFGKPDPVDVRADGLVTSLPTAAGYRRSIYVLHRRKEMPTILENFDLPQMIPNCIERPNSTVASQALHLMNNAMVRDLAADFATSTIRQVGDQPHRQVEHVYHTALSRTPSSVERELAVAAIDELTRQWQTELAVDGQPGDASQARLKALSNFCHTIVNSAAFLYVD